MQSPKRQMKLGAFLFPTGHHVAAWRYPQTEADGILSFAHYRHLAQVAERGKFDMIFLADNVAARLDTGPDVFSRLGQALYFEPLTLLSALAVVTEHIGLAATASTTYNEPYHIARKFASLDYLSNGRAAWNVVTSSTDIEARNFNRDVHMEHALRYERAREFVKVVKGLWDSWEDEALLYDKASGRYLDADKLHVLNHKGKHFSVEGPLNITRPPQGYPVLIQAGASADGQDFAAETAEVIFAAQRTLQEGQEFYAAIKGRLAQYGRSAEQLIIMPGLFPVVGATEQEAREKYEALQDLIHPEVGLKLLSDQIGGFDLSSYPLDGPLPEIPETNHNRSRLKLVVDMARRENLTIRQLYKAVAGGRGHRTVYGTAEQIADQLTEWFLNGAADGFNIMPPYLPGGLEDFVEQVVPILQERGLYRTAYEGATLRENLGLARPTNQFHSGMVSALV